VVPVEVPAVEWRYQAVLMVGLGVKVTVVAARFGGVPSGGARLVADLTGPESSPWQAGGAGGTCGRPRRATPIRPARLFWQLPENARKHD
jgi:hypothetical protein